MSDRLDYRTTVGWVVGHSGLTLQNPQQYVDRLADRIKDRRPAPVYARVVTEDGETILPGVSLPPFHETPFAGIPVGRITECAACGDPHERMFECLL